MRRIFFYFCLFPFLFISGCNVFGSDVGDNDKPSIMCGNGIIEAYEECDGTNLNGLTCKSLFNYGHGTLTCGDDCKLDTTQCGWCGDGIVNGPEICDGSVSGDMCRAAGYWWGTPTLCTSKCYIDAASQCHYALQWGTDKGDSGISLTMDKDGNFYVVGITEGAMDGNLHIGGKDIFLTKFDASRNKLWTKQWGTMGDDMPRDLAVIGDYVYVLVAMDGVFSDDAVFPDKKYLFLIRYDTDGNFSWLKVITETASLSAMFALTTDKYGYIYITGGSPGDSDGIKVSGETDAFLSKYNASGKNLWTKQWGTSHYDSGTDIVLDKNGFIYVLGATQGSIGDNMFPLFRDDDMFLSKYDAYGHRLWTKQWGSAGYDFIGNVVVDNYGYIYVTGRTKTLNGYEFDNAIDNEYVNMFLMKCYPSGNIAWIKKWDTTDMVYPLGMKMDEEGNLYILGDIIYQNGASEDRNIMLVKYDSDGNKLWRKQWGSLDTDVANDMIIDDNGYVYITGTTEGLLDNNVNSGEWDVFVLSSDTNEPIALY